jgi:hypothetical protein
VLEYDRWASCSSCPRGGFKYLRQICDNHLDTGPLDEHNRTLFAIAAYNCGSGRVASRRTEAAEKGLDPNVWFNNVELIAARRVGQETVLCAQHLQGLRSLQAAARDAGGAARAAAKLTPVQIKTP